MSDTRARRKLEEAVEKVVAGKDRSVLDAAFIMALVDEVTEERLRAEREAGVQRKPARQIRSFTFDVATLQKKAKAKKAKEKLDWAEVWAQTGITVAPLKQHLGDNPPTAMGLGVATALMAWTQEWDLQTFLIEE